MRILKGILLVLLTVSSFIIGLPPPLANATPDDTGLAGGSEPGVPGVWPRGVGADPVPDLRLPKTVVSSVDSLIGAGGVVETSPENLTLYNLAVRMRLLGGAIPHDELLGPENNVLSSWSFWGVEAQAGNGWVPLIPRSNRFALLGTNATGTSVVRTMNVSSALWSGLLTIAYKATSKGPLKWDLEFTPSTTGRYRLVYAWKDVPDLPDLSRPNELRVNYRSANYTFSWSDVPSSLNRTTTLLPAQFLLSIELGSMLPGSRIFVDPSIVATGLPSSEATAYSFQRKVFFEPKGGRYWVFYYDGYVTWYTNSSDGINWHTPSTMPNGWPYGSDAPTYSPTVFNAGQTIVVATGNSVGSVGVWVESGATAFSYISYTVGIISGPRISWSPVYLAGVRSFTCDNDGYGCTLRMGYRHVSVTAGSDGQLAFSANWHLWVGSSVNTPCAGDTYSEGAVIVVYKGGQLVADSHSGCGSFDGNLDKSVVVPSDAQGGIQVIYEFPWAGPVQFRARQLYGRPVFQLASPFADAYVASSAPFTNYGAVTELRAETLTTNTAYSFLNFAIPSLPEGGQLSSAVLKLKFTQAWGTSELDVLPLAENWDERNVVDNNGVTWNRQPARVSSGISSPKSAFSLFVSHCSGATFLCTYDISNTISGMYKPPGEIDSYSNHGVVLFLEGPAGSGSATYYSRETSFVPVLNMTFSCCIGQVDVLEPNLIDYSGDGFSVVSDAEYGIHVAYPGVDGNITYAYRSLSSITWDHSNNAIPPLFPGNRVKSPTLTVDYSTNSLYVLAMDDQGIVMKSKSLGQHWRDQSLVRPVVRGAYPAHLGTNYASASSTNSSRILLIWAEGVQSYNVMFASIPIQTVWSPYGFPADPWDGNGVSPYGQYFANLGEYVSPVSGMLTVRQTDLSVPGRGLDLEVTRVYVEPNGFLSGAPYNYETYQWAPLGKGWQFNFPWMNNIQQPSFLHLGDGQGYRIPYGFWNTGSLPAIFENHDGEHFRLERNSTGVFLYAKSGLAFYFDPGNRLTRIADTLGNNITFAYDLANNRISNIRDTVGRIFLFCYGGGLVTSIEQSDGSCGNGYVRRIILGYSGQRLENVTDPIGRVIRYQYDATGWLLARATYPTGWYTSYTYGSIVQGNQATTYQVFRQMVNTTSGDPVRRFEYNYTRGAGDQTTNSTVRVYNGTSAQPASYTTYAFSFAGIIWNISDTDHNFVRGVSQRFGTDGEAPREIVLVSPTQSYTNYYRSDPWGNPMYSRRVINPSASWYHESFSAYYNNGLPIGYYLFGDTFSQEDYSRPDNSWRASGTGLWRVEGGEYSLTGTRGNESRIEVPHKDAVFLVKVKWLSGPSFEAYIGFRYQDNGKHYRVYLSSSDNTLRFDKVSESGTAVRLGQTAVYPSLDRDYLIKIHSSGFYHEVILDGLFQFQVYDPDDTMLEGKYVALGTYAGAGPGGPVHVRFDDVRVQPIIFSSNFFPNALTSKIHDRIAGSAENQNSTCTCPLEAYYNYASWGGLNATKMRYDLGPGTVQWISTANVYDAYGNLKVATDAMGRSTYYQHSPAYGSAYLTNQTRIDGAAKITTIYNYTFTTAALRWVKDPMNGVVSYQYDSIGRVTRVDYPVGGDDPLARYILYTYDDVANYVNATNENGWKTRRIYDGLGRLSTVERFLNGVSYSKETYTYNWQDKVTSETDPLENKYTYNYDVLGRPTVTTKPDGNSTRISYLDTFPAVTFYDEDGNVVLQQSYDRLARLIAVFQRAICFICLYYTDYFYDEVGNLRKATVPFGSSDDYSNRPSTVYNYDNLNRLTTTIDSDGSEIYNYDDNGNLSRKIHKDGSETIYEYDSLDRVKRITSYGQVSTLDAYTYDNNGNLLKLQSQNATITYTYDPRNRVQTEAYRVNGASCVFGPAEDGCGGAGGSVAAGTLVTLANRTAVPVQNLQPGMKLLSYNTTTTQYEVSTITSMETVETTDMLVIRTQDPLPLRVDNATAQKLWVKQSTGAISWLPVTMLRPGDYLFNAIDQRWTMVTAIEKAPSGRHIMYDIFTTAPYNYIANNYLDPPKAPQGSGPGYTTFASSTSSSSSPNQYGYSVKYHYYGETFQGITYNDWLGLSYKYDGLGRMVNATYWPTAYATFAYDKADRITSLLYGNGLAQTYTYDKLGRPKTISLSNDQLSLKYNYNKPGTVAKITGQVKDQTIDEQYTHDISQHLTNSTLNTTNKQHQTTTTTLWYEYDGLGNRQRQSQNGAVTSYSYGRGNNTLRSTTGPGGTTSYVYDRDGNLVSRNSGSSQWTYSWDASGNLLKVSNNAGVQGIYAYDGLGRKVESVEGSTFGYYAYIGTETLVEILTGTGGDNDYLYANGMRIAKTCIDCSPLYYHTDPLGSTRLVTDSTRAVKFSDNYQPYGSDNGTPYCQQAGCSTTHKFTGKQSSQTTGLQYNYQRWYDQSTGRFISMDPAGGSNQYTYGLNNPTRYIDPDGASPFDALSMGVLASQIVTHGFYSLGLYTRMEGKWMKLQWGPGHVFSENVLKIHTNVIFTDLAAKGKARQYWKFDNEAGGGQVVRWNPNRGRMSHIGDKYPGLGRAAKVAGYFAKFAWVAGVALSAYDIGSALSTDLSAGYGFSNTIVAASRETVGWAGAIAGAEAFGEAGVALGLLCGPGAPVCSAVGGFGGAIIGGALGYFYGSQVGDWVGHELITSGTSPWGWRYETQGVYIGGGMTGR